MDTALTERHRAAFGHDPQVVTAAPGRVNLIGEHTDYNDGFVLPMAIDRQVQVAASRGPDRKLDMFSVDLDERVTVDLGKLGVSEKHAWANYPMGVVHVLAQEGIQPGGLELTISGDVPQGAGLSSSAALEVACALAVVKLTGFDVEGPVLARMAQRAECEFVGVRCGIMDQFVSRLAIEDHALLIDCRSLQFRPVRLPLDGLCVLVTDSNTPRRLADSAYNQRRAECEAGLRALQGVRPGSALRDYELADLQALAGRLDPMVLDRCQHVIEENERVLAAELALSAGDLVGFGRLMNASHESLRDLFEVSCPELDWLVERARETPGVLGSRMTGAGFGGCTVSLIRESATEAYAGAISAYPEKFGHAADVLMTRPAPGARVVFPSDL